MGKVCPEALTHHRKKQNSLIVLALGLLSATCFFLAWDYSRLLDRIPLYAATSFSLLLLKGGGSIGYKLGYVGTAMLVFAQLYSVQRRLHPSYASRLGGRRIWLRVHCLLDILAVAMVLIHAGFPFSFAYADPLRHIRPLWGLEGWVGVSGLATWVLIATFASGLYGRYLHSRIGPDRLVRIRNWRWFHILISGVLYVTGMLHLYIVVWARYVSAV